MLHCAVRVSEKKERESLHVELCVCVCVQVCASVCVYIYIFFFCFFACAACFFKTFFGSKTSPRETNTKLFGIADDLQSEPF